MFHLLALGRGVILLFGYITIFGLIASLLPFLVFNTRGPDALGVFYFVFWFGLFGMFVGLCIGTINIFS